MDSRGKPPSREELDARLAELQADPEKAAQFKAQLQDKLRKAIAKLPKLDAPLDQLISEAFSFLVHELEFTEHDAKRVGQFGSTTLKSYSSDKVSVNIWAGGVDVDSFCGIGFGHKESGEGYGFRDLLRKRYPQFEHPRYGESTEIVRSHLKMYASALKEHASDVLRGDFGVFREGTS